jgi:uncharacterized protein DUF4365
MREGPHDSNRKRRTRQHVIADLGVNHVERQALLCGFSVERMRSDYGVDLAVFTYDRHGRVENGCLLLQVKATEHAKWIKRGTLLPFRVDGRDLARWLAELFPVALIVFDVVANRAYSLYLQQYFARHEAARTSKANVVHFRRRDRVTPDAMRELARRRDSLLARLAPTIDHG